ncbi:glycerol-3-phosphate cytidylyltransferase [Lachnospiraceae bacterium]|nr:adenylyltransferase/cytidyltransferase family protein [Acetatifactor sp.]GFH94412.1 glycerol-3-phosphate cytidylyltransferase [Lachnospiraceae bacterium]
MKEYGVGFICGFFDILHDGHIDILCQAKKQCSYLIVAVGTDEFMKGRKNRNSVFSYEQRVEIVRAIRYVDQVVPETNLDKISAYYKYKFNVMFAGNDHEFEPAYIDTAKELKKLGVDTIFIPRKRSISSTLIREHIQSGVSFLDGDF